MTVTFPPYRALGVTVKIGVNNFPDLVMSIGTSASDIAGKHFSTSFPVFGSKLATCTYGPRVVPCKGKAFLYVLYYAPLSGGAGGILNWPEYHITNASQFPGAVCHEATLEWNSNNRKWYWIETNAAFKPKNGSVTYPAYPNWGLAITPGQEFVVSFYCT
jgi:hypothetical protein